MVPTPNQCKPSGPSRNREITQNCVCSAGYITQNHPSQHSDTHLERCDGFYLAQSKDWSLDLSSDKRISVWSRTTQLWKVPPQPFCTHGGRFSWYTHLKDRLDGHSRWNRTSISKGTPTKHQEKCKKSKVPSKRNSKMLSEWSICMQGRQISSATNPQLLAASEVLTTIAL